MVSSDFFLEGRRLLVRQVATRPIVGADKGE